MAKIHKKPCVMCGNLFTKHPFDSLKRFNELRKFCSTDCSYIHGKKYPNIGTFKKGESHLDKISHRNDCKCRKCKPLKGSENNKWKGGNVKKNCQICQSTFYVEPYRDQTAKFCSKKCVKEFKQSDQERERLSKLHKQRVEDGLHNLYCGATEKNMLIRQSGAYKKWRTSVFVRDDYTCQICKTKGGKLNAHHIKSFSVYEDLRMELDNGQTLCVECHRQTDSWGKKVT